MRGREGGRDRLPKAKRILVRLGVNYEISLSFAPSFLPSLPPLPLSPPITPPLQEVLGFVLSQDNWPFYNWSVITTIAMFTSWNNALMCHAHSKGVRVVINAEFPIQNLSNADQRAVWVQKTLETVQENFADGINVDIESPTQNGTDQSALLTLLMSELFTAFKKVSLDYQVTFDVAWSPRCIDDRCYQFDQLAKFTDFLVIMAYDERSQIFGPCIASANSALVTTTMGVQQYLDLGIDADRLVLGLPWYGYNYPCVNVSDDRRICDIPIVPFRGVNCSDAAGSEVGYSNIEDLVREHTLSVKWDEALESPFFTYLNPVDKQFHQVSRSSRCN